jgi:hypothetical protein
MTEMDEKERRELRVHLDRPPAVRAPFARGDLSLDFRWAREDVDYEQLTIRQWPQFELAYTAPTPLDEIMSDVSSLHSLLTLCTDGSSAIESVDVYRPDYPERVLSGEAIPGTMQKIELRAAFIGSGSGAQQKRREPHRMLVSFDDVGGIEAVATWLNEAPRLRAIVGSLITMRSDTIFGENRFLNVCSAAEGFHRSTIGGSHIPKTEFKSVQRMLKKYLPRRYREWFDSRMAHATTPASTSASSNSQISSVRWPKISWATSPCGVGPFPSVAMTLRTWRDCASSTTAVTCTGWRRACST